MRDAAPDGSDTELLQRFVRGGDQTAFELLVWRHGAAVLAACRRILNHEADAEDAFQASFLILARRARSISRGASVGAWLHRVATRFARRIAVARKPRLPLEVEPAAAPEPDAVERQESIERLDAEIERLGEKQRLAVILVYLNGLTAAEAGRELGIPTGTVESRLAAARRILHRRLSSRGVSLLVAIAPAVLAPGAAARTASAAVAFPRSSTEAASIIGSPSVALARESIHMGRLRTLAAAAAVAGFVAIAAGAALRNPAPVQTETALEAAVAAEPPADPRLQAQFWGEPLELGALGKSYSYFQTLSPDGKRMLVQHRNDLYCVNIAESRVEWSVDCKGLFNAVYSPDGRTIATAQWENGANLLDAATGKTLAVFFANGQAGERPDQVGFFPDGKLVVHTYYSTYRELKDEPLLPGGVPRIASTIRYSLIVWDPKTKKDVKRITEDVHYGNSNKWQWLKGGSHVMQTLTAESENGVTEKQTLSHVDPRTGKKLPEIEIRKTDERPFDMSPDGTQILLGTSGDAPRVIEAATGKFVRKLDGHRGYVTAGAYSPDGKVIATVSGTERPRSSYRVPPDGPSELIIRDADKGDIIARFDYLPSKYDFTKIRFSPDGQVLIAETKQNTLVAWGRFAFERPAAGKRVGLPPLPEPPPAVVPLPGGYPEGMEALLGPQADTLAKMIDTLPRSGRTIVQQVDVLYAATLGRLPTPAESKLLVSQLGEKPTAEKWKEALTGLTTTPEFLAHANSLIQRINGKNRRRLDPLLPNFGDP